jgi:hypothetical protein
MNAVRALLFILPLATSLLIAQGGEALSASRHDAAPPDSLAKPIADMLSTGGVRVLTGKDAKPVDFWWVKALPLRAAAAEASWADVDEGTLVGVVSVPPDFRDIRGRVIKPGVYTLRYGIQPANGDHLGVSPYRDFLLLSPAASDTDPAPRGHDGTVEISKLAVGGSHPAVLSIDPPAAKAAPLQLHKTELDHDAVVIEVPLVRDGKPGGTLRFGLVLIGRIDA